MSIPEFTAEASIYKSTSNYATGTAGAARTAIAAVRPQQLSHFVVSGVWAYLLRTCRRRCLPEFFGCLSRDPACDCESNCASVCNVPGWSEAQRYSCRQICQIDCEESCGQKHLDSCRTQYDECVSGCYASVLARLRAGPAIVTAHTRG